MLNGDQIGSLVYLVLLAVAIAGWLFASSRRNLGRLAQYAAVWSFIFIGAIVAVGLWSDIRQTVAPRQSVMLDGGRIEVPRAPDGHYYLTLGVNGVPVRFVVDTGASEIVLSREDAARAGIALDRLIFSGRALTANGMVETAPVRLETVQAGPAVETGVRAVVNATDMQDSLLGMSYLQRFERLEISGGRLVLER
ncbi:TIGR02281 family clan AA aspartic protease [Roseibacterium sp. SDUM158017]|uniref:retropepsin-like aspartic protease family protein n=1 Tax=Roseicyclus salinarum TaxID=3036773 RepID=UPI002415405A|nr:TIGR02281 family clan AA aspartic protease [Roseibacterium sp. SDUM158017]MDG4648465.1 TIGR02281 family clan AA aspartic protease [Roseibacterium sp. SDUM158017]